MSAKLNIYKCMHFLSRVSGDEELVRERMCCAIALSLSRSLVHSLFTRAFVRSFTHGLKTYIQKRRPLLGGGHKHSTHENTKLSFEQKKTKMASYVSYILVSNERRKNIVQTGISPIHTNHHTISHSRSHAYTFTKIFISRTNPICL